MVKVPSYDNYAITNLDGQKAYSNTQASPNAFGANVGQGMQQLGQSIQGLEQTAEGVYKEIGRLNVENKYTNETSDLFRQADNEYNKALGKNAVDGYGGAVQRLQDIKQQTLDGITDPFERMNMENLLNKRIQQSQDAYSRHSQAQLEVYDNDTFEGYVSTLSQGAVDNYKDPKTSDWYLRSTLGQIEAQGQKKGKPLEWVQAKQRDAKDKIYSDIATTMLAEDPYQAMQYMAERQDQVSPEIYAKVRKQAQPYITDAKTQALINQVATGTVPTGGSQGVMNSLFQVKKPPATPPAQINTIIEDRAKAYSLDPAFVRAVVHQESRYKTDAVSPKGATGLMQLMPDTAKWLGLKAGEEKDPAKNVDAGCRYLSYLSDMFHGNQALILAGYNAGQGNVKKAIKKAGQGATIDQILNCLPMPQETVPYVKNILRGIGKTLDSAQNDSNVTTSEANVRSPDSNVRSPSANVITTTPSTSFLATGGYKKMDELNTSYAQALSAVDQMASNPKEAMDIRAGLTAYYKQQKTFIDEQMNVSNDYIMADLNKDFASGVPFDLNKKRQDPTWAMHFENMSPQAQKNIYDDARDQAKQNRQEYKDTSEELKYGIMARLGTDADAWTSFDIVAQKGLTNKDRSELQVEKVKATKEAGKKSDLLFKNVEQGKKIFNEQWQLTTGIPLTNDSTGKPLAYWQALGRYQAMERDAVELNGGKPLDPEQQRLLVLSSQKTKFKSLVVGSDNTIQSDYHFFGKPTLKTTEDKSIGQLVDEYTQKGGILEGTNRIKVKDQIEEAIISGVPVNPIDIKKRLQGK